MEERTVFELLHSLQGEINTRLRAVLLDTLSRQERELLVGLQQAVVDVKADMRDYIAAETDDETRQAVAAVRERLEALQQQLLEAGNKGIFGAADVAIISAFTEQIMAKM